MQHTDPASPLDGRVAFVTGAARGIGRAIAANLAAAGADLIVTDRDGLEDTVAKAGGSLIAMSSVAGLKALPSQAHYSAAKHGVVGLVRAAAIELGPFGIRVNSVHPWGVDTRLSRDSHVETLLADNPSYANSFGSILPEPRLAEPSDIASAVVWLASDASRCITGIQLPVDMGATTV